jgi:hypothetical protein
MLAMVFKPTKTAKQNRRLTIICCWPKRFKRATLKDGLHDNAHKVAD